MKTAAIYCRVSTDNQEQEGTSLQTQLEACLKYCQDKGYDLRYRFSEAYSGLTLERPKLNELRELVRNEQIDVVVVYCLDRLSRDPTHGVILTQEFEKHGVRLEAVTEDVDNSELGKLISYIRGFASKLEAEKIKERTSRGRKAKAKQGEIPGGGFSHIYGYDYISKTNKHSPRRVINETEAEWVRKIYRWLVDDHMSTFAIVFKLRELKVPSKRGKHWRRSAVYNILTNPAYTGRTYAFTTANHKQFSRDKADWIELPGVTPGIITDELYEAAQERLRLNKANALRNTKREYLLKGRVRCAQCGHTYYGRSCRDLKDGKHRLDIRYICSGKLRMMVPEKRCHNRSWKADKLEDLVWSQVERVLDNPELIIKEIEKQRRDAGKCSILETELEQLECQLKAINHDQAQLLQWALKGFPEDQVIAENKKLNAGRESLKIREAELEAQIKASRETTISLPKLDRFVELIRQKLITLDFDSKRQVLDMLGIKVWLDDYNVEITGVLPVTDDVIVTTQSS
jgi:site-specific DNA recombinase